MKLYPYQQEAVRRLKQLDALGYFTLPPNNLRRYKRKTRFKDFRRNPLRKSKGWRRHVRRAKAKGKI